MSANTFWSLAASFFISLLGLTVLSIVAGWDWVFQVWLFVTGIVGVALFLVFPITVIMLVSKYLDEHTSRDR